MSCLTKVKKINLTSIKLLYNKTPKTKMMSISIQLCHIKSFHFILFYEYYIFIHKTQKNTFLHRKIDGKKQLL